MTRISQPLLTGIVTLKVIKPSVDSTIAIQINKADGTTNVLNVDTTNSRVGIGTTGPSSKLEVYGGGQYITADTGAAPPAQLAIRGSTDNTKQLTIGFNTTGNYAALQGLVTAGYAPIVLQQSGGNVGIGTTGPNYLLQVGSGTGTTNLFQASGQWSSVTFSGVHTPGPIWNFTNTGTGSGTRFYVQDANNAADRLTFDFRGNGGSNLILAGTSAGNVGIGTTGPKSTLHVSGSMGHLVVTKTADYTAASETVILCNATSNNIVITLPAATNSTDRIYHIKKIDSSANTVTIDGNASETIDGATTQVISTQYESLQIVCDGSNWYII